MKTVLPRNCQMLRMKILRFVLNFIVSVASAGQILFFYNMVNIVPMTIKHVKISIGFRTTSDRFTGANTSVPCTNTYNRLSGVPVASSLHCSESAGGPLQSGVSTERTVVVRKSITIVGTCTLNALED